MPSYHQSAHASCTFDGPNKRRQERILLPAVVQLLGIYALKIKKRQTGGIHIVIPSVPFPPPSHLFRSYCICINMEGV